MRLLGGTLTIRWEQQSGEGNINLQAAAVRFVSDASGLLDPVPLVAAVGAVSTAGQPPLNSGGISMHAAVVSTVPAR
jgi:hypothetical protein